MVKAIYHNGDVFGASRNHFSPNGYGQFVGTCQELRRRSVEAFIAEADTEKHLGERVSLEELPEVMIKDVTE
jgi:hypothetical protein